MYLNFKIITIIASMIMLINLLCLWFDASRDELASVDINTNTSSRVERLISYHSLANSNNNNNNYLWLIEQQQHIHELEAMTH